MVRTSSPADDARRRGRNRVRFLAVPLTVLLLAAGASCSDDEPAAEREPAKKGEDRTVEAIDAPEERAPAATPEEDDGWSDEPARRGKAAETFDATPIEHESTAKARLVDLVAEPAGDGVERLVFTFADTKVLPKYRVDYVDVVRAHPEDDPIELEGEAFLQVAFKLTNPNTSGRMAVPPDLRPELPLVRELLLVENLGGSLRFAVGLGERAEFRTETLTSPTRLVVEVQNS